MDHGPAHTEGLSRDKQTLLTLRRLKSRLEEMERAQNEPIGIVGIGCRFPGAATPELFWRLLRDGHDAISEVPRDRWDINTLYDPDPSAPGKMSTRHGGFLERVDQFDPQFFGISPRETLTMDPQQRLLLEVAWEALENAGQAPDNLVGSETGVFIGITSSDYLQLHLKAGDPGSSDLYFASGNTLNAAAGRLSYVLGLQGPSMSTDTACSSSLVALHLACQSLRLRECRMALAGGVNVILSPDWTVNFSKAGMMAADGRCKTFDAAADGYVRGEGCGVIVLKRLSDARADGDRIDAVIVGSAVNQDGRSNGFTAPNEAAQQKLIEKALATARIAPTQVNYVEAHGTGTPLGDPIEVQALASALCRGRSADDRLIVGSVKTNIGHLEAAAGVAGVIKTVLALRHREIPPHLHFKVPNPYIPWTDLPVTVPTTLVPWPERGRRIAGVSSFGFSGTNAHILIEEAPASDSAKSETARPIHVLTVSGKSEEALREQAARYAAHFGVENANGEDASAVEDVCFTANAGRAHFPHRLAVVAASRDEAQAQLSAFLRGDEAPGIRHGRETGQPSVAFLFTGQGSQYAGMGRQLYESQPVFRKTLQECDEILRGVLDRSLLSIIYPEGGDTTRVDDTVYAQPANFAIECALAKLWQAWGIEPFAVLGHSLGEFAAACVAGVFSLEDGLKLVAERAQLMHGLAPGAMASVFAGEQLVASAIAAYPMLAIAAVNAPDNTVISGREEDVEAVLAQLTLDGVEWRRVNVPRGAHSALVGPMIEPLRRAASAIRFAPATVGLISNVTGGMVRPGDIDAEYWCSHARKTVRFLAGLETLRQQGCRVFLEIGPNPVLVGIGRRTFPDAASLWLPSLRSGQDDWRQMLDSLASLYAAGARVDWAGFDRDHKRSRVALPTYPFQRAPYWTEGLTKAASRPVAPPPEPWREWLYECDWQAAAAGKSATEADHLLPPAELADRARQHVNPLCAEHDAAQYETLFPEIDALCTAYVVEGFRQLGWEPRLHERIDGEALRLRFGVIDQHRRLFARLLEILAEERVLRRAETEWAVVNVPEPQDPRAWVQRLRTAYPVCTAELSLLERCASRLAELLRGECHPMQMLFPDGSTAEAEQLYERAPIYRIFNSLVAKAIAAAVEGLTPGRTLRVLEIGGGTGGTTAYVLPVLPPDRTEYTFTDVSKLFTARARVKFKDYPFVEYRPLDIEKDPEAQGFPAAQFDVILAANVLHATPDLRETMGRVKKLLAPRGLVVILEGTEPQRLTDLTFGLTEGWWKFNDFALRPSYLLMQPRRWVTLLGELGFVDACAFPEPERYTEVIFTTLSIIMARSASGLVERARVAAPDHDGMWMVFADEGGSGQELVNTIERDGGQCVVVRSGETYQADADNRFTINAHRPEDFHRIIADAFGPGRSRCCGIAHFWALDDPLSPQSDASAVDAAVKDLCGGALHLVQALDSSNVPAPPRVTIVTRRAQSAGTPPESASPVQATLWGLGRVLDLEHPELRCVRVDLDRERQDGEMERLYRDVLAVEPVESEMAFRGSAQLALRMVRSAVVSRSTAVLPLALKSDATYLIVGGLTGLGLVVAGWMVERGARHIVLIGRSEPSADTVRTIGEMERQGADVRTFSADVSKEDDVRRVLDVIDPRFPLRGVIHSAMVMDDGLLTQLTWERFEKVLAAKVRGSWVLDRLTQGMPLDFFVLFSSAASFFGGPGLATYAAANAFLDALAYHRRARGLPALSINWGSWDRVGLATPAVLKRGEAAGVDPIDVVQGLRILEHLLQADRPQVAVLPIHWPTFSAQVQSKNTPKLLASFAGHVHPVSTRPEAAPAEEKESLRMSLLAAEPGEREAVMRRRLNEHASRVLQLVMTQTTLDQPLSHLGLDSLMALELKNRVEKDLGMSLPLRNFLAGPSVTELASMLTATVASREDSEFHTLVTTEHRDDGRGTPAETPEALLAKLDELSDEHVEALLGRMMSETEI